jgi:hypothetical protein
MKIKTLHLATLVAVGTILSGASWSNGAMTAAQNSPFGDHFWVLTSATIHPALDVDMDGKPDTDLIILRESCEHDDASKYRSDGVIVTDHGPAKCDEEEREEETGTWSYDSSTKAVTMDHYDSDKPMIATVVSSSSTQLVLISSHESASGTHTITTTLKSRN